MLHLFLRHIVRRPALPSSTNTVAARLPSLPSTSFALTSRLPSSVPSTISQSARTYKTRTALKLRCEHCFFCRRRGKLRVVCPENPRHKQRQK
ncbi:ribosomal protein L36-domain-containing protein [Gaertneriomyces semiglobifer]|nr:ribosomal protein L36-domain-containing protein [Gaertneriomyces semiglobifer]